MHASTPVPEIPAVVHPALLPAPLALNPDGLQAQLQHGRNDPTLGVRGQRKSQVITRGETPFAVMQLDQPIPVGTLADASSNAGRQADGDRDLFETAPRNSSLQTFVSFNDAIDGERPSASAPQRMPSRERP